MNPSLPHPTAVSGIALLASRTLSVDALVSGKGLSGRGLHWGHSPLQAPLVREQLVGKCSHLTPPPVGVLMSRPSASVSPPCRKPTLASQGVFPSGEYWFAHIPCPVGLLTPRVPSVRSHPVSVGLLTPHVCGFAHTPCPISSPTPRVPSVRSHPVSVGSLTPCIELVCVWLPSLLLDFHSSTLL